MQPPRKVAFTWHPGRDAHAAQTVEVTFTETADGTDVVLTHSGFEKLAEEAAPTREGEPKRPGALVIARAAVPLDGYFCGSTITRPAGFR